MRFEFELVLLDEGQHATLYSFRKNRSKQTELEKFWAKGEVQEAPDHDNLKLRLYQDVLDKHNFSHRKCLVGPDRWLRDESDATDPEGINAEALCARIPAKDRRRLAKPYPRLRLYCFRMRCILIAGNGGVKREQRIQDDPDLTVAWNDVRYVMKRVHKRVMWTGDLDFEEYTFDDGYVEDEYLLEGNHHFEALNSP